jgi:Cyclophilin type peptidyl-prolyl cis-trans isomerase/CLD
MILHSVVALLLSAPSLLQPSTALASSSTTSTSAFSPSSIAYVNPSEAQVTHKLYMNVRVSRQDGTFYVRDDLPDAPENRVFQGRLVVGLFGKVAPTCVERFLSYVAPETSPLEDSPMPSYGRSYFTALDPATGLLLGGTIPSLQLTDVGGSAAIQYGGRLLPAKLWIEPSECRTRVSHARKGLLTHRLLDATPAFGITTRTDTRELDRTYTAFGTLLMEEGDAAAFLSLVQDLPTYSVDRPASSMMMTGDPASESVVEDAAEAIFNAQRSFFRKTAKAFGDTRLDKIYDGKILRRIEVTQVGLA